MTRPNDARVGDKFVLNKDFKGYKKGDLLTLSYDDDSDNPRFSSEHGDVNYIRFNDLDPATCWDALTDANKLTDEILAECKNVLKTKGADYAGDNDVHENFKRNATRLGLTKYQVWALYFNKHVDAINNSIKRNPVAPQVESEPLSGRVVDAINYLIRLHSMLEEDKPTPSQQENKS